MQAFTSRIRSWFSSRSVSAADLDDELRAHIQLRADDLARTGLPRAEAERRARIEFGGYQKYREDAHEALAGSWTSIFFQDLRVALRILCKSPGFAATAVLTLALAIGANAVVFSVMDALVFRGLPVANDKRIYGLVNQKDGWGYDSYANYLDLRDRNHSFDGLAVVNIAPAGLDTGSDPTRVWLDETSGNYFDLLGLQPYLGRFFHASDEHGPNSAPWIVLSYASWNNYFHGDRGVVGRVVQLNRHPFTILGVAPPDFIGTFVAFSPDMFVPIVNQEQVDGQSLLNVRGSRWISESFGLLKPGVSLQQASADLTAIRAELARSYPRDVSPEQYQLVRPGPGTAFGGAIQMFLTALMALAGLILLAACANLGSLFAARASDRSREVALRLALGSSRRRILRQLLMEASLIGLGGGAVGLGFSAVLLYRLSRWQPFPQFPLNLPVQPGTSVIVLALCLALLSGLLFGMVPVRQVLRASPWDVVRTGALARGGGRLTLRDILVAVQIAICAVLITASMVAIRGLARSLEAKVGVVPQNALLVNTDLRMAGYSTKNIPAMQKRMAEDLRTIPGVAAVGIVDTPPLHMGWTTTDIFTDQTVELKVANAAASPVMYSISPEYLTAAGTSLLAGRNFTWHDDDAAPPVALINAEFARRIFGSVDSALGRYFKRRSGKRILVVGVVEDGKYTANIAEQALPALFLPILQQPAAETWMVLRSPRDSKQLSEAVHARLRNLDPALPSFVQTWSEEMNGAMFASRMATLSLGVLGMLGAMLSVTGIFGMAAYSVSRRLRELGIRIALGAQPREVLQAALGRAIKLLALGSLAGLVLGILARRVLAAIVWQATPRDPLVLATVVVAMALLGLIATWIPAQRALSLDPLVLLHEE